MCFYVKRSKYRSKKDSLKILQRDLNIFAPDGKLDDSRYTALKNSLTGHIKILEEEIVNCEEIVNNSVANSSERQKYENHKVKLETKIREIQSFLSDDVQLESRVESLSIR